MGVQNYQPSDGCPGLFIRDGKVVVAFADPRDKKHVDMVGRVFGNKIIVGIAGKKEIHRTLNRVENALETHPKGGASENAIIQTVNELVTQAAETSVTDIHIEPGKKYLRIRYRKDGTLIKYRACRNQGPFRQFNSVCEENNGTERLIDKPNQSTD